jgi:hypothetical protein
MIKIIQSMPAGTIGVEAVGKVTDDDYRDVLLPAISEALEHHRGYRDSIARLAPSATLRLSKATPVSHPQRSRTRTAAAGSICRRVTARPSLVANHESVETSADSGSA